MKLAHPDVVNDSALSYVAYLNELIGSAKLQAAGQQAVRALRESIRNGLLAGDQLRADQVPFTASLLASCSPDEKAAMVNQWSLGLGSDDAAVIVMGTEPAFDVNESVVGLALESCASALLGWPVTGPISHPGWLRTRPGLNLIGVRTTGIRPTTSLFLLDIRGQHCPACCESRWTSSAI